MHQREANSPICRALKVLLNQCRLLLAIILLLPAIAIADDDVLRFTLPWLPVGDYSPYSVGLALGYYDEAGIDLTVKRGFGSIDATNKLAAGQFDVGEVDLAAVISGRLNQSTPVKCIASVQTISPGGFLVLESSGIRTLQDIAGKTIATQPGNAVFLFLPMLAEQQGLDFSSINITHVDANTMAGLLLRKRVDAAGFLVTNQPFLDRQARKMGESVRAIHYSDYGLDIYGQCIAANDQIIAQKPDVLRRFLQATLKARLYAQENPAKTIVLHRQLYPEINQEDALLSLNAALPYMFNEITDRSGPGRFDMERVAATYAAVVQSQGLEPVLEMTEFVDTTIVDTFLEDAGKP